MSTDRLGAPPLYETDSTAGDRRHESLIVRSLAAVCVACPWIFAIWAGFDIYIFIAYPRASLDRIGPALAMLFCLTVSTPVAIGLGFSTCLRKPMAIAGVVVALLLGAVVLAGHLVLGWT